MPDALLAENLCIGHDRRTVVSDLSFRLPLGESLALIGGNGSGKTTLLRTLAGLLPPLSGRLEILGDGPAVAAHQLAWLGQFQNTNPLLPLRARDVVRMAFFSERGLWGKIRADDEARIDEALAFFQADDFAKRPISELSGGQRQRVYLSYVLVRNAKIVLLDEPLSNLDAGGMELYNQAMEQMKARGSTIVVATHNLEDAATCDKALALGPQGWQFGTGGKILLEMPHHQHEGH